MYVLFLFVLFGSVCSRVLEDEEYDQIPELYYLDSYEDCLEQADGLYCLGVFQIKPGRESNEIYDYMVEYAEETFTFNRTLLHRGYCISERCPQNGTHYNSTLQFENCVKELIKPYSLNIELNKLHYCHRSIDQQKMEVPTIGQLIFLCVICVLIMMNVIGTLYDAKSGDNPKKIRYLMAWSIIANWKLLTSYNKNNQSPLLALHGIRVCIAIGTCLTHAAVLYFTIYVQQPRKMENMARHPLSMFLQNSTAMEQWFIVMSAFLFAYHLKQHSMNKQVHYKFIPLIIAKRIFRLLPVTLLVVSFAATWWPMVSSGPIWPATVGAESEICKRKFWTHLFFINNLIDANNLCVMPTWAVSLDVQMHIMATIIMVCLLQFCSGILLALGLLFILSCLLNAVLAYTFDLVPMLYLTVSSENLRTLFHDAPSFAALYISPWGSMPACFLGLFLGYLYFDLKDTELNIKKYKWLVNLSCMFSFVLMFTWVLLGYVLQHITHKMFKVAYAAMERSIFQLLLIMSYVVACVSFGSLMRVMSWRGWHALSRLSLPVMLTHWLVNMYLIGSTPQLMSTTRMDILNYGVITTVYTFLIAVPITILVEMPMKKVFDLIGP